MPNSFRSIMTALVWHNEQGQKEKNVRQTSENTDVCRNDGRRADNSAIIQAILLRDCIVCISNCGGEGGGYCQFSRSIWIWTGGRKYGYAGSLSVSAAECRQSGCEGFHSFPLYFR